MKKPIINISEVELMPRPPQYAATGSAAGKYDAKMGIVAQKIGAQKLGYNITAVAPGMMAFPFHNHRVNEEMFFVIQGTGELRIGSEKYPIRQGDIIACPPGDQSVAHQIKNTGNEELRYLAVSTKISPEICDYPDTGKFGVLAEFTGADGKPAQFRYIGKESESGDYWDGN